MGDAGAASAITLVRILDLPEVRRARTAPAAVDLTALVEWCEARLAQVGARPGAVESRLAAKSRERFVL